MARHVLGRISRLAAAQHGVVAVWQLERLGLSSEQIRSLRQSGRLHSHRRAVLRLPGSADSPQRDLLAACLAAGSAAVASHWAAGGLLGLRGCAAGTLELTVPRGARARPTGVRIHQVTHPLARDDWTRHLAVPTTTPARTILDLAATEANPWLVERMIDEGLVRRAVTLAGMAATLERAGSHHVGAGVVLAAIDARTAEWGDRFDSLLEMRVRRVLAEAGVKKPQLHQLVDTEGGIFEVDFAWLADRAGLDASGFDPHGTRSALDHDARRAIWLLQAGWKVTTVTSAMSDGEIVDAARTVLSRAS